MAAVHSDQVLRDEAKEILEHRNGIRSGASAPTEGDKDVSLRQKLNECKFVALCLSGGGIRSAAFSLGVIQALAAFPRLKNISNSDPDKKTVESDTATRAKNSLLAQFDYLSTVSGGGYIGSWLSAWCSREGFQKVWDNLIRYPDPPGVEPRQVGWLRSYSNYLTPKLGIMSADARTAISIYLCNLFLNWLIILPVFCCAVLGMKILAVLLDGLMTVRNPVSMQWLQNFLGPKYFEIELSCLAFKDRGIEINWVTYVLWCGLLGVILLLTALAFVSRHLVFRSDLSNPEAGASQKGYLFCAILPSVLSAILLAQLLGSDPFSRMFEKLTEVGCDAITLTRNVAGVPIADVHKTGPAENAKLQKGDIIVKFDGNPIKSEGDLEYYLRKKKSGDEVLLDVERENEPAAVLKLVLPLVTPDRNREKPYPVIEDLKFVTAKADALEPRFSSYWFLFGGGVLGAIVYSLGLLVGWASSFRQGEVSIPVFLAWVVSGSVYGAMLGFAFYLFVTTPGGTSESKMLVDSPALPLTFGVPWILSSQLLAQIVFVGLSSRRSGSDWDREWQGRAGGWMLVAIIGWFAISCLTFGALLLLLQSDYVKNFVKITTIPVSAISGIATALLSKSRLTSDIPSHPHEKSVWTKFADVGLAIAAPLFVAGLVFLLSITLDKLLLGHLLFEDWSMSDLGPEATIEKSWSPDVNEVLLPFVVGFILFFILLCCASFFININRFSLHAFYRNRLIRAFLGATRDRKPNPFHGFDPADNPNMSTLWPPKSGSVRATVSHPEYHA